MSLDQFTKEQIEDMSLIEMTYVLLEGKKQALPFREIMDEIVKVSGLTQTEVRAKIAQFYTDLNIDGRFLGLGDNVWGLRSWYPVDQAEEDTITQIKPKKKKAKKVDDEDLDDYEDEDLDYEDLDEFDDEDLLDDEEEDFDDLDESAEEFEDEELLDDDEELLDDLEDDEDDLDEEEDDIELEDEEEEF
ncbi:DNA-directed RNA polymerase subunit delta [Neobacillus sp. D3-1R]|uniref:DNA-directed RNA polymerase subunit delta n=1 Tax=Neobacillus sp. D3-1R TaxID=3445778 RepID=UPI003F9EE984